MEMKWREERDLRRVRQIIAPDKKDPLLQSAKPFCLSRLEIRIWIPQAQRLRETGLAAFANCTRGQVKRRNSSIHYASVARPGPLWVLR